MTEMVLCGFKCPPAMKRRIVLAARRDKRSQSDWMRLRIQDAIEFEEAQIARRLRRKKAAAA